MACPVCFNAGVADDTVRTSLNFGILVLLGVTACVLAGFLRFVVSIIKRSADTAPVTDGEARPADRSTDLPHHLSAEVT